MSFAPPPSTTFSAHEIRDWQGFLASKGYDLGPAGVDGVWGPRTAEATRQFQAVTSGLAPSGEPWPPTLQAARLVGFIETPVGSGVPATQPAGGNVPPLPGPIGKISGDLFTPRGLGITAGVLLVGYGLVSMFRR